MKLYIRSIYSFIKNIYVVYILNSQKAKENKKLKRIKEILKKKRENEK